MVVEHYVPKSPKKTPLYVALLWGGFVAMAITIVFAILSINAIRVEDPLIIAAYYALVNLTVALLLGGVIDKYGVHLRLEKLEKRLSGDVDLFSNQVQQLTSEVQRLTEEVRRMNEPKRPKEVWEK